MTLWVVRADKNTPLENRDEAQQKGYCFIGWREIGNCKNYKTWQELNDKVCSEYFDKSQKTNTETTNQIWNFINEIKKADYVAVPLTEQRIIVFGKIIGDYEYQKDNPKYTEQCKKVEWLNTMLLYDDKILTSSWGMIGLGMYLQKNRGGGTVYKIDANIADYIFNNLLKIA